MIEPWRCECRGRVHPGHFECPDKCAGGHIVVRGEWRRCHHDGTTSAYGDPVDRRTQQVAHEARAAVNDVFDARAAAAGEHQPELEDADA